MFLFKLNTEGLIRISRSVGFSFLLLISTHIFASKPLVIQDQQQVYALESYCELLHGSFNETTVLKNSAEFKPYNFNDLIIGIDAENVHWFRFEVENQIARQLFIRIAHLKFGKVLLYELKEGKLQLVEIGGTELDTKQKLINTSDDIFPLYITKGQRKTYYLRTNRYERKSFKAEILSEISLIADAQKTDLWSGIILGGLIIVTLYQFFIFLITNEKDYLRLTVYLLSLTILSFLISGYYYIYYSSTTNNLKIYYFALAATSFLSYYFAYYFLNIKIEDNKIIKWASIIILSANFVVLIASVLGFLQIAYLVNLTSALSSILFIYAGIFQLNRGFKPAKYFLIAYIPPCFTIVLFIFYTQGLISYTWFMQNSLIISFCLHAILFSLAVAQKIKTYKDEADALMVLQKESLERKVAERTQALAAEKEKIQQQSEQLKTVMKELHHRVKNNLTIVSSLLELQGNRLNDEVSVKAFQEGQQRIEAMSLIHQRLYKSEQLTTINMSDYINELSANLMHVYGFTRNTLNLKIKVDCEELDIDNAIPIGLILNELITNTLKYAYKDIEKPELSISLLKKDGLTLEVQDNGIGVDLVKWSKPTGSFGKRLIYGLSEQIGGEMELNVDNGTCFKLKISEEFLKIT